MISLDYQTSSYCLLTLTDHSMLVLPTRIGKLSVQLCDIQCLRHWYPVVPSKVSGFSFDASFFMRLGWCAKTRLRIAVRTEGHETHSLFSSATAEDSLYS